MNDRIVLRLQPFEPYQHIYIFHDGIVNETLGTNADHVAHIVLKAMQQYNLTRVELTGPKNYTEYFERVIKEKNIATYNIEEIEFVYLQLYKKIDEVKKDV